MAYPTITTLPDAPSRGEDKVTFTRKANALLGALGGFVDETNAAGEYVEAKAGEVETNATVAQSASLAAVGAANYKGDWVSGYATTGYSLGMSVTYSGSQYTSKINFNLSTPSGVTDANWLKIIADNPDAAINLAQLHATALYF